MLPSILFCFFFFSLFANKSFFAILKKNKIREGLDLAHIQIARRIKSPMLFCFNFLFFSKISSQKLFKNNSKSYYGKPVRILNKSNSFLKKYIKFIVRLKFLDKDYIVLIIIFSLFLDYILSLKPLLRCRLLQENLLDTRNRFLYKLPIYYYPENLYPEFLNP